MLAKGRFSILVLASLIVASLLPVVALAGHPVGTNIQIHEDGYDDRDAGATYNSKENEYLVVSWKDRPGNDDIRAERIGRSGRLLGGAWVAAGPGADRSYPDVTYNPDRNEYLVTWMERNGLNKNLLKAQRLAADARPIGQVITIDSGTVGVIQPLAPAVAYASASKKYLVVWERYANVPPAPQTSIYGQVLNHMGELEGGHIGISVDPVGVPRRLPRLAYNRSGNGYLVVWEQFNPANSDQDIYGRLLHGTGGPTSGPIEIATGNKDDYRPHVASIPTGPSNYKYLVTWSSKASGEYHVHGRMVNGDGDPAPARIIIADFHPASFVPRVAASESAQRYLVVWQIMNGNLDRPLLGQEVSNTGELLGPVGEFHSRVAEMPAVASGSTGTFLAVWQTKDPAGGDLFVSGQFWGNRVYLPLVIR